MNLYLICIYNDMYTVCSYDIPQRTGWTDKTINRTVSYLQATDKSYGQHTYLQKTIAYSRPDF